MEHKINISAHFGTVSLLHVSVHCLYLGRLDIAQDFWNSLQNLGITIDFFQIMKVKMRKR